MTLRPAQSKQAQGKQIQGTKLDDTREKTGGGEAGGVERVVRGKAGMCCWLMAYKLVQTTAGQLRMPRLAGKKSMTGPS